MPERHGDEEKISNSVSVEPQVTEGMSTLERVSLCSLTDEVPNPDPPMTIIGVARTVTGRSLLANRDSGDALSLAPKTESGPHPWRRARLLIARGSPVAQSSLKWIRNIFISPSSLWQ